MIAHLLHQRLIRLMYRVLAPSHPRGRTDMHAVIEEPSGETVWVHTHGLSKFGLREIEFIGVPDRLGGYAHGLLFEIMGYMKRVKPIGPDEHVGGAFVHAEQRVLHLTTARLVSRADDPPHTDVLRFVDYKAAADSGFPKRLFAAHIASLAEEERSPSARERLGKLALDTYRSSPDDWLREAEIEKNPGNWISCEIIGHALCDQGRMEEGLQYFREVIDRCPAAALRLSEIFQEAIANGELPPPERDPRSAFWSAVDTDSLQAEIAGREGAVN